jgi:integrase
VKPWSDAQVGAVTDAHPGHLRLLPVLMTSCGLRIGEATAVALEDFDFDEKILHLRRQLKKLGDRHIYALPKNDLEREVPLPDSTAAAVRFHVTSHPTWPCTLPWEKLAGKPQTHNLQPEGRTAPATHYYASVMLAGAVSVKELAEYLGHHDPAFTLRVYSHLMPGSHGRARQVFDAVMFRPSAVADGTWTE